MSNITANLARHLREIYFGVNWTWSNIKDNLSDVSFEEANTTVEGFNNILSLTYHIHYYIAVNIKAYKEGILNASDKFSFHPLLSSHKKNGSVF